MTDILTLPALPAEELGNVRMLGWVLGTPDTLYYLTDEQIATMAGSVPVRQTVVQISGAGLEASEVMCSMFPPTGETWTFPGNLSTSSGKKLPGGTNPGASYVIDLKKNGSNVGTITISTAGVVSFATTSGAAVVLTGATDVLQAVGPATPDAAALGYVFNLVATKS